MVTLQFTPQIFVVKTTAGTNECTWNLLTLDGSTPDETVYFMHNQDAPSSSEANQIIEAVDNKIFEENYFINNKDILDYRIDQSVFESAGDDYSDIREQLKKLLN